MSSVGFTQTVTITKLSKQKYCVGDTISVIYDAEGAFISGNIFSFEVKKYTDTFAVASTILKTKTSSTSGIDTLYIIVTSQIANDSLMYRVTSSSPAVLSDSMQYLSMYDNPPASFKSSESFCMNSPSAALSLNYPNLIGTYSGIGVSNNTFTPSVAGVGSHNLLCTIVNTISGCSITDTLKTHVYANPIQPFPLFTIDSVKTLPADTIKASGDSVVWSTSANFTSIIFKGNNFLPSNFDTAGIYKYYCEQIINGCTSDSVIITVVFEPDSIKKICNAQTPTIPPDSSSATLCAGDTTKITCMAHSVNAVHNIMWLSGSNSFVADTVSMDSLFQFTKKNQPGVWSYYAFEHDNANNCFSPFGVLFTVTVHANPIVSLSIADVICFTDSSITLDANPSGGVLTLTQPGSSTRIYNDSLNVPAIGKFKTITLGYTYIDANSCIDSINRNVYIDYAPVPSMADQTAYLGSIPTLVAPARGSSYKISWYNEGQDISSGVNPIFIGSYYTPTITQVGTYTYYVVESDNYCSSQVVPTTLTVLSGTGFTEIEDKTIKIATISSDKLFLNTSVQGSYSIYSILGVNVVSNKINGNSIAINLLTPGIYILEFVEDGKVYSLKFIKE